MHLTNCYSFAPCGPNIHIAVSLIRSYISSVIGLFGLCYWTIRSLLHIGLLGLSYYTVLLQGTAYAIGFAINKMIATKRDVYQEETARLCCSLQVAVIRTYTIEYHV